MTQDLGFPRKDQPVEHAGGFARTGVCVQCSIGGRDQPPTDFLCRCEPWGRSIGKLNRVNQFRSEEKLLRATFGLEFEALQEPCSSHASANVAQVSSQRLPPRHLAFRNAIELGWPRMNPDVGRQPAAGIKIARKIKLIRDRRVRLLLWSAAYYQYSLGLRCLPWHHLRSRQH